VVAITGKPESSLARLAHHVIDGSVEREADPLNLAPTCSSTVAMALGDALAVALMRTRGFTPQDFASLHPGGSLGRRLSLVRDHMHTGANVPKVVHGADFHHVLSAVTEHNFGVVAVLDDGGHLIGAISDGDLRRALLRLDAKALKATARELMSAPPKTIAATALAIDAVTMMSGKSTSLFVLGGAGGRELVGLVRLHDLLAAKIL
jgi:arabinose-5-phosphate isomerase